MENRLFSEVLCAAIAGDPASVESILVRYMPLINKYSTIYGKFDEDMRQYIIMRIIMQIPKFNPKNFK